MSKRTFKITIDAPAQAVWSALWDQDNYRDWAAVFAPDSQMITDMKEGSKVKFVDGSGDGMLSKIEAIRPNEFLHFRHLGIISGGKEITGTPESTIWEGYEKYTLTPKGGATEVTVDLMHGDISEEFQKYFADTFPKALNRVKEIAQSVPHA